MRTYKLMIAYDGTRWQGWQRQALTERTVQGVLERTISEALGYPVEVNGSGRTDAGVHASGQTASVVLSGAAEQDFFTGKVNAMLPEDIRILDAQPMNIMWMPGNGRMYSGAGTVIISRTALIWMRCRKQPGIWKERMILQGSRTNGMRRPQNARSML